MAGQPRALHGLPLAALLVAAAAGSPDSKTSPRAEASRSAQEAQRPAPADDAGAGPRRRVAGMRGVSVRSRVVYLAAPEIDHVLVTDYAFPRRARWLLALAENPQAERVLRYRFGERFFAIESGSGESREPIGAEALGLELQLELRRAAFLWPDGLAWQGEGPRLSASLGAAGSLEAELDEHGRPRVLRSRDAQGEPAEALEAIEWREERGRWWPARLELTWRGEPVWFEEVEKVQPDALTLDVFFLPPDRRVERTPTSTEGLQPRHVDLPASVARRLPLRAGADWGATLRRARETTGAERERLAALGLETEEGLLIELAPSGEPSHCVIRLAASGGELPEGFVAVPESPALTAARAGPRGASSLLEDLRRLVPLGARPGRPYLRLREEDLGEDPGRSLVQVVLPLVPAD